MTLRSSPVLFRRPARIAASGLVLCSLVAALNGASAQVLSQGDSVPPGDAAPPPGTLPPGAMPTGLRGSVLGFDAPADAAEPLQPLAPVGPVEPEGRPRRLPAGQGSALLQPVAGAPRLPALQAYPSSQRPRGAAVDTLDGTENGFGPTLPPIAAAPSVAALPVPPLLRRRALDADPYGAVGYTIGTFVMTPYIEQSLGYDTNPDQVQGGRASAFSRTEGGFGLLSQWSGNELKSVMHAGYDAFFSNPQADRPDAAGTVDYRYEVSRDMALDAEGRFAVSSQRSGSPEVGGATLEGRPLISSEGATLGGNTTFGPLTLGLHGLFDRTQYENGRLADGTVAQLDTENFNDYGLSLRADYQLIPTLKPFGEVVLDTRVHDDRLDLAGYARDSDGVLGRVGTSFEMSSLVTGTVSAGYEDRTYKDPRLKDLRGPVVDASVIYAVTPLTTLTLLASTSFDETTLPGSSGTQSRTASLQVSHALFRNLTVTGILTYLNTDYEGTGIHENTYSGTLRASYALSRSWILDATYNHERLNSTLAGSSFTQDVVMVGMRWQH